MYELSTPTLPLRLPAAASPAARQLAFVDLKSQTIFSWIDWVVSCNRPLSFLENHTVAKYAAVPFLSTETLEKYMILLTITLEDIIAEVLPKRFGIMWDGWTFRTEHYIAVFAVFAHDDKMEKILLAMAP
ncbi:hypothetical protein L914_07733 [Phytophthora nicotianae]|uniref:Uncharacterized protein n=1 Tax=Phytophthora nicotianae TaxID=4792 RepID=W2NIT6_PHYNI|nr:hypothetical protein L914_07733 [Phytophthora nicotianae]